MFELFKRLFTKNKTEIPLLWIMFNYQKYKNEGKLNSCTLKLHPLLCNDEHIKEIMNGLVNYIRDNYEMKNM